MISKKPTIPNGYQINGDIIDFCVYAKNPIEIYKLQNGKFLNLITAKLNISNSKIKKYDIASFVFAQKEYLYFVTEDNRQESAKELLDELTTLSGFDAVAGMTELKQTLIKDVITPIMNRDKYEKFKLAIPNGILLYGPPGCGKTYIVRRLAEEIGFSFLEVKHSDVTTPYIHGGVGKIAEVFNRAKLHAPAIVFIDELDGMVPERSSLGGNQSYKLEEINEFLTHLNDAGKNNILVVGATNQPQLIDEAILRSGRMDKKIFVMPPDFEARQHLFKMYLCERPIKDIDYDLLSSQTSDYSCSDIEYICNEAARSAVAQNLDHIDEDVLLNIIKETKKQYGVREYKK